MFGHLKMVIFLENSSIFAGLLNADWLDLNLEMEVT
jgi:hypothetical protein